jgi:AcrR family transcriptional regulator
MTAAMTTDDSAPALSTRDRLIAAAAAAFNAEGYLGTDTNKIARAAGFAPQTFYRHFPDKLAIFVAVYEDWQAAERRRVAKAVSAGAPLAVIAREIIAHHQESRGFRRSLNLLAVEAPAVRAARAQSRETQLAAIARTPGNQGRARAALIADLLRVERLCDAAMNEEFADLDLNAAAVEALVAEALRSLRGEG